VACVDQQAIEAVLQQRPDRLPVHAGGLHRDALDPVRFQPVAQREQPPHGRLKLGDMLNPPATLARRAHARHHGRVVHIQRRRALHNHIHPTPPSSIDSDRPTAGSLDSRSIL
jgi:hypothetical protein